MFYLLISRHGKPHNFTASDLTCVAGPPLRLVSSELHCHVRLFLSIQIGYFTCKRVSVSLPCSISFLFLIIWWFRTPLKVAHICTWLPLFTKSQNNSQYMRRKFSYLIWANCVCVWPYSRCLRPCAFPASAQNTSATCFIILSLRAEVFLKR